MTSACWNGLRSEAPLEVSCGRRTAKRTLTAGLAAAVFTISASGTHAESMQGMDHRAMDHGGMAAAAPTASPATKAYEQADMAMHKAMQRAYTGDADRDFLQGMIPHHEGAVAMARVVLKYGKDAEVKKLAQQIVDSQEREIAEMKRMLGAEGAAPSAK